MTTSLDNMSDQQKLELILAALIVHALLGRATFLGVSESVKIAVEAAKTLIKEVEA